MAGTESPACWRTWRRWLLLALLCRAATGYVLMPFNVTGPLPDERLSELSEKAWRWTMPQDAFSSEGLGGGLAWVLDPKFCEQIVSQFPEESVMAYLNVYSFVSCTDIHDTFMRGFETWGANHVSLSFTELSNAAPCESPTGATDDACPWEIFIGTADGVEHPGLAAYVTNHRASAFEDRWWETGVRSTANVESLGVDAFRRSTMRFQTHICWYLDATFCYYFQAAKDSNVDVLLLVRLCLLVLFCLALARVLAILLFATTALCRAPKPSAEPASAGAGRRSGCLNYRGCLDYLSTVSPCTTLVVIFLAVFPPIFYQRIFMPCWECYDFEAAVAHEIGHVLGFGHPDEQPGANLEAACEVSSDTCLDPFSCATRAPYREEQDSIMTSLTKHAPRTCLAETDRAGLQTLYPTCDGLQPDEVVCTKPVRLSGWLRLTTTVGVPFLLAVVLIMLPLTYTRWRDARKIRQLSTDLTSANARVHRMSLSLNAALAAISRPVTSSRSRPASRNLLSRTGRSHRAASNRALVHPGHVPPPPPPPRGNEAGGQNGRPQLLVISEAGESWRESSGARQPTRQPTSGRSRAPRPAWEESRTASSTQLCSSQPRGSHRSSSQTRLQPAG